MNVLNYRAGSLISCFFGLAPEKPAASSSSSSPPYSASLILLFYSCALCWAFASDAPLSFCYRGSYCSSAANFENAHCAIVYSLERSHLQLPQGIVFSICFCCLTPSIRYSIAGAHAPRLLAGALHQTLLRRNRSLDSNLLRNRPSI